MADSRAAPLEPQAPALEVGDEGVFESIAAGHAARALELLITRYGESIYGYCRRVLGNDADGDDVSQLVFLQAFEGISARVPVKNVSGWLKGIARHRCLDRIRSRRRGPSPVAGTHLERALDDAAAPLLPLHDPRAFRFLDECLDGLDDRSRVAIVLRFHDELSYEEIGARTGDTSGALRVRVSRGLIALRDCLEKKGVTP
ncbi:MAG TPA: sigma-70 family RNA polymerase sigma factor [Haliangiales bacterium]|nr:sigma-70 family RNA polymerase sigma factor [Haliangiales bacterium]